MIFTGTEEHGKFRVPSDNRLLTPPILHTLQLSPHQQALML
jgi:hypothetical protein